MVLPVAINRRAYAIGETIPSILTVPYDPWATFPFLQLPAELRNKIYDHVFPESRVQVIGNHPQKELAEWKRRDPYRRGPKPRYRLSCRLLVNEHSESTPVPLDLLEVCRKINTEATAFLYGRITFQFDSIKTINKFLNKVPKAGIANITSIEIIQNCYGEPHWDPDRDWKDIADEKWADVCARLARELTSLQRLDLDLTLASWPMQLKMTDRWTRPLVVLRGRGLSRVRVQIHHYRFARQRLLAAARSVEDLMMTEKGREKRDLEQALETVRDFERKQAEKAKLPAVRATKSMRITMEGKLAQQSMRTELKGKEGAATRDKSKAAHTYFRKTGLESFTRIDLNTVGIAFC